jgi:hypothetical protein
MTQYLKSLYLMSGFCKSGGIGLDEQKQSSKFANDYEREE